MIRELVACEMLSGLQCVDRAAVRALGGAAFAHVQIDLGVGIPGFHFGRRAGAKHAALGIQVFGQQFNGGGLGFLLHLLFLVNGGYAA